jgi:hypothetical protein
MAVRAEAGPDYPIRVCALPIPPRTQAATVAGVPLPLAPADPRRILVIGDTGCRLKGSFVQACNDPRAWPFRLVADVAAYMKPDLVIHVGDYHYRETPCPAGRPECAGSPYGDVWDVWKADFFAPAAGLLATAPVVLLRGNHEECNRGGKGWSRTLDPRPFDAAAGCQGPADPFFVGFDRLRLAVFDVSTADEAAVNATQAAAFKPQFDGLAASPVETWLLVHRPLWGIVGMDKSGEPFGSNLTLVAAAGGRIAGNVSLMLAGHIHAFEAMGFDDGLPAQLVVGEGGTWLDTDMPRDLAGLAVNGARIVSGVSLPGTFGFTILERATGGWTATAYDVLGSAIERCRLNGRRVSCG